MDEAQGILIGALLTGLAGLLGHAWQVSREHKQWLRNEKRITYAKMRSELLGCQRIVENLYNGEDLETISALAPLMREVLQSDFDLIASPTVSRAMNNYLELLSGLVDSVPSLLQGELEPPRDGVFDELNERRFAFQRAMRKDLRVSNDWRLPW